MHSLDAHHRSWWLGASSLGNANGNSTERVVVGLAAVALVIAAMLATRMNKW